MENLKKNSPERGFTLIELLVVIAILAVLASVVVLVLNPAELLAQARDTTRISDTRTLNTAIALYLTDMAGPLAPSYTTCYLSTTSGNGTSTTKCGVFASAAITVNSSTTVANYTKIDGTGWIPINFGLMVVAHPPLSALPVDPVNSATYYYAYVASSTGNYELDAFMESNKYKKGGSKDMPQNDGGDNANVYETGRFLSM
jgi:prepilin-type N-terminal cleavage/methylation domain-containing protein